MEIELLLLAFHCKQFIDSYSFFRKQQQQQQQKLEDFAYYHSNEAYNNACSNFNGKAYLTGWIGKPV
jgi:hypothetical protein